MSDVTSVTSGENAVVVVAMLVIVVLLTIKILVHMLGGHCIRVLVYSYYTTITGWGVLLIHMVEIISSVRHP